MFNIGAGEMILIALVLLIAVGPEQLPGVIRRTGQAVGQLRSMSDRLRSDFMSSMDEIERAADPRSWAEAGSSDMAEPSDELDDDVDDEDYLDGYDDGDDGGDEAERIESAPQSLGLSDRPAGTVPRSANPSEPVDEWVPPFDTAKPVEEVDGDSVPESESAADEREHPTSEDVV